MSETIDALWPQLVSTALVGTQRRSPSTIRIPASMTDLVPALSTEADVLDAAGAVALARRAGLTAVYQIETPTPATVDDRPLPPRPAAERLRHLLLGAVDTSLLELWLTLAAERNLRVPGRDLPELFRVTSKDDRLRPLVVAVAGNRGGWLAAQRPEWHWVRDGHATVHEVDDEAAWTEGDVGQRLAYLATARRRDPARGRELLESVWAQEPPAERAAFIAVLAEGLSLADEAFCEAALDDRRKDVRSAAVTLLAALDGSAYQGRMRARALACVTLTKRALLGAKISVEPPRECDASCKRDGIEPKPPIGTGMGERAWWFEQIIAAAPLSAWAELGKPADLLKAPVTDGWAGSLRRGWAHATIRASETSDWAAALIRAGFGLTKDDTPADRSLATSLYPALTPRDALSVAKSVLVNPGTHDMHVIALLDACPRPWPRDLLMPLLHYFRAQMSSSGAYVPPYLRRLGDVIVAGLAHDDFPILAQSIGNASEAATNLMETLSDTASTRYRILQEFA